MSTPPTPSDPPVRTARVASGEFTYTDQGEGPTIVAVHGLPGSNRDYRWLGAALPKTVRLVRVDMPGFGGTPLETNPGLRFDQRGAFVAGAIEALGLERCVLVGHSMGGPVALSAAVQARERVAALALLASVGLRPHVLLRRFWGREGWAKAMDAAGVKHLARPAMALLFRLAGFPASTPRAQMVQSVRCIAGVDFEVQRRNLAALRVPTLAAWAEDDAFIEPAISQELAAALPRGPRLSWPTGGHNIQKTQAVELAEALVSLASASTARETSTATGDARESST